MREKGFVHILVVIVLIALVALGFVAYKYLPNNPLNNKPSELYLTIDSPTSNTQAVDDVVTIKGRTLPNTTVVLFNLDDQTSVDSDENGNFESQIVLNKGENLITVSAFAEDGQEKTVNIAMNYNPK